MEDTGTKSEEKPRKSLSENQQDLLMMCISENLGFTCGKPVAAFVIYKCLLHSRSFEVEETGLFDRIIDTAASTIKNIGNNDELAYWICNTSTLLLLLQPTLKASGAASLKPQKQRSSSASPSGRVSQGPRASPQSAGQVEATNPALLFKKLLTEFLENIYGMIRDNLIKEISPLLDLCIQAPRTSPGSSEKGHAAVNIVSQQTQFGYWQSIVKILYNHLKIMKAYYVPPFLVQKVFTQIFSFINVQLFNSLLSRRECCSFGNGEYVKAGLAELKQWCCAATEKYVGSAWDELNYIRQAVAFLVTPQKQYKTLKEITNKLCPLLSIQQLYSLSTLYWDDKYGTHSVSQDVMSKMRVFMTDDSSSSFLLRKELSIPFFVDDLCKSMSQMDATDGEAENSGLEEKLSDLESEDEAMSPTESTTLTQIKKNDDLLMECISQNLGFSGGKPIAAFVIHKCLLHWRSLEVEKTSVFDRIIQTVASAIEVADNNNDVLAYWLCNTSTLLTFLQHTLKASSSPASLFGRISKGFRESRLGSGNSTLNDDSRQVEAKYPALLFKQQLTAYLEKIYGMIRDNLKKEISPLLGLCIQAPRVSRASLIKGNTQAKVAAQGALIAHWQSIVKSLNNNLKIMKENYVPLFLVRKVHSQVFSFINVQLFNSLLLRRECCSFSNGEYVKAGLAELELWCSFATEDCVGAAWYELKHVRQAVGFLTIHQKRRISCDEITNDLCPVLSIPQLYRISTMYWDDKYGTQSVSADVISSFRIMMSNENDSVSGSFLLDDDSSIPFTLDELYKSSRQLDVADVEISRLIRERNPDLFS